MSRTTTPYTIDSTPHTAVVVCSRCAWRALTHSKPSAYRLVADHLRRTHNDLRAARIATRSAHRHHKDAAVVHSSMPAESETSANTADSPSGLWEPHNTGVSELTPG